MPSNRMSPNQRETLSALSTVTGKQEYLTSTNGVLNTTAGGGGGGSTQYVTGTATPNPATGTLTVFDNAGTITAVSKANPLPVNATLTVESIEIGTVDQGTGGSSAWLTKIDQTGTNNQVQVANFPTTQAVSAASLPLPAGAATSSNQTNGTQKTQILTTDVYPAIQSVTVIDSGTTSVVGFDNQTITTGTPTVGSVATFPVNGVSTMAIQTAGTWTGTLRLEGSTDGGVTYTGKFSRLPGTSYAGVTTYTANCVVIATLSGYTHLRVRATVVMTGTAVITVSESINQHAVDILNPLRLLDSTTNTLMTIKAASTPPVVADTSIVTVLNPNAPNAVATTPAVVSVGQTTSNTTAVQLSVISTVSTNGILVQAISTNTASVFIGGSGVTTSTGFELQAGQATPFTAANITALFVVGSNGTDKVCWSVL